MTRQEVLDSVQGLSVDEQMGWLVDLGMLLTICAREGYSIQGEPGSVAHLTALNELQHQVYGCMQHLPEGTAWPMASFLDGLLSMARAHGVDGSLGWALRTSISRLGRASGL
jgi:hypothetical protein